MKASLRHCIQAVGIVLCMSTLNNPAFAEEKMSQDSTDARQETQIWTTYELSPYLRASDLKVSVHKGKATLTGQVNDEVNKELAQQIALGVSGIKEVDNQIKIDENFEPPKATSTPRYSEKVNDASITAAVKSKLLWSKNTDSSSIKVETHQGKVTLTGTAINEEAKALAGRLTQSTRGVDAVSNQLVIGAAKPGPMKEVKTVADGAGQNISDAWITTKVKSTFMYSSNVDGNDISVTTQNGIVTLSGKLHSGAEQALAVELAQNVRGVKDVRSQDLTF